jgi:hypothetical protein
LLICPRVESSRGGEQIIHALPVLEIAREDLDRASGLGRLLLGNRSSPEYQGRSRRDGDRRQHTRPSAHDVPRFG